MNNVLSMKDFAKTMNDLTFDDYYKRLMLIARSVFKWSNLPNHINEKWIEKFLYYEGSCVFYDDPIKGYMVAKYTPVGKLNYYDEPTKVKPYATGYNGKVLENGKNCVIISNNDIMMPTDLTLQLYAYRLAEATRTSDVNIKAQKTPVVVLCTDKQKLSFKRAMSEIEGNQTVIYGAKEFDIDSIKVLNTNAPIVFDKIRTEKHGIWNEAMTFLGINNGNQEKKERQIVDEINANNEQVLASGNVFLKAREEGVKQIKDVFGLDLCCEFRDMECPKLENFKGGEN